MEFEQNLKANEQTGKWFPLWVENERDFFKRVLQVQTVECNCP